MMEEDRQYLPLKVYKIIKHYLESCSLDLVSGSIKADKKATTQAEYLDDQTFIKDIQYYGYILIEAADNPAKDRRFSKSVIAANKSKPVKTFIALLDLNSQFTEASASFMKLLSRIPGFESISKPFNMNIIIISHSDLSVHIMKKVDASISKGSESNGFTHIHAYPYRYFTSIRPNHKLVAPQRILSKAEELEVLAQLYTTKLFLPKIRRNDPICIWLDGEIGDVIEAKFISETSGYDTKYMVVRP